MSTVPLQPAFLNQAPPLQNGVTVGKRRVSQRTRSSTGLSNTLHRASESTIVASTSSIPTTPEAISESSCTCVDSQEAPSNVTPWRIVRTTPQDVMDLKYTRTISYRREDEESQIKHIKPLQVLFDRDVHLADWTEIRVGKPYFYDSRRNLLTRTDLYGKDPNDDLVQIQLAAQTLIEHLEGVRKDAPEDTEIVLGTMMWRDEEDQEIDAIGYYLVSMSQQAVFWFDALDDKPSPIDTQLVTEWGSRPVVSQPHLGLAIKWHFWMHVELFPAHKPLPKAAVEELKRTFDFGLCDSITSSTSMFPYDSDTASRLIKSFDSVTADEINGPGTFIAARLLASIYRERFLTFWGEAGARLTRNESAFYQEERKPRSWVLKLISPLFFFMPFLYMQEFEELYVDESVHYYPWRIFIEGLKKDWENSITPATVLIATNIGFLSIGSIDGDGLPRNTPALIMSYISTILAAFIYIVCQILQRHHRHHVHGQASEGLNYITKRSRKLIGLEAVAIAFSIPTALFLWSMLTFLAAMMVVFFDSSSLGTRIALGTLLGLMLLVLVLLLYLESDGSARGTLGVLRLMTMICTAVREWYRAHWLRVRTLVQAGNARAEDEQNSDGAADAPSETTTEFQMNRILTWIKRNRQPASSSPV